MSDLQRVTEALAGGRSFDELRALVNAAAHERFGQNQDGRWVWVRDMSDTWAVVEVEGTGEPESGYYQVTYTVADDGEVTLGEPTKVEARTTYQVTEATIPGRLLEAKGSDDAGGRVFGFRVIEADTVGRNRRRYSRRVIESALSLYEGAKCFDRHRTEAELRSSTISGLVGTWRDARMAEGGMEADLHLLPSATHTAETLDASLAAQGQNLPPLVGASHDVLGRFSVVIEGGQRVEDATEIASVNSVDVVADPAAGGRVTRMVAGGIESETPIPPKEGSMNLKKLLELLRGADATKRGELLTEHAALLDEWGITADQCTSLIGDTSAEAGTPTPAVDASAGAPPANAAAPAEGELVGAGVGATEGFIHARDSVLGRQVLRGALAEAKLPERALESVTPLLPERFTEAQLTERLTALAPNLERAGLVPRTPDASVTSDERKRKVEALDAMFMGDYRKGYRSLREAFIDVTGTDVRRFGGPNSEDLNRHILRESMVLVREGGLPGFYDSQRATESVDTATWAQLFGDALHKRMIASYSLAQLGEWRKIVSSIVPVPDFKEQKPQRMGGYGLLPIVPERAPYQPLTTPPDEEVRWDVDKRGGTEDWTLEAVANDDLRAIQQIPTKLGRAAALTLYHFVFDFLRLNPTMDYDATALFAAGHGNTDNPAVLGQSTLSTARRKMRRQTAYGDSNEFLGLAASLRYLVVPPELEEVAFQLTTSAVSLVSNSSTIPNIHANRVEPIVVDYFTDADDWFGVGDPTLTPTIEIGFYQGREDPELFTQADPTQGSVFDADVFKIKIRHIYGGDVLDHRGFYRGAN